MSAAAPNPGSRWLDHYQHLLNWLDQHRRSAWDSLAALARDPVATLLSAAVLAVALSLPATLYLLLDNLARATGSWDRGTSLTVFLQPHVDHQRATTVAAELRQRDDVATVDYLPPDHALQEFRADPEFGAALDQLDENPLPGILLVTPAKVSDSGDQRALVTVLEALADTDLVSHDQRWLERLDALTALGRRLVGVLALLLALGILLVIASITHTAITERRRAIEVMALVGATDGFIRRPFLYTGAWLGAGGGLLAALAVSLLILMLSAPVAVLGSVYDSGFTLAGLSLAQALRLIATSTLLGWIGAWIGVSRRLKKL